MAYPARMAMKDKETYAPLVLFEYPSALGTYCLMLSDAHMVEHEHVFHDNGRPDPAALMRKPSMRFTRRRPRPGLFRARR